MEAALLLALIACLQQVSNARCIPGCDDTLQQLNYYQHLNASETHVFDNVLVNLREAEGSDDRLRDFNAARVCPWRYEMDYNASRLPQVMYTARCDTETWCDHTTGQSYRCLPLEVYTIPIMIGEKCDLFNNTEWKLSFVNRAVSCYPSRIRFDSETEICNYLVPPTLR